MLEKFKKGDKVRVPLYHLPGIYEIYIIEYDTSGKVIYGLTADDGYYIGPFHEHSLIALPFLQFEKFYDERF
jgi:hypothetical protein